MPVTYKDVIKGSMRHHVILEVIKRIDLTLSDSNWVHYNRVGTDEDHCWTVSIPQVLSERECDFLAKQYADGWGAVGVAVNASTGTTDVTLYQHRPGWNIDR